MSSYDDLVTAIRAARSQRDAARAALYRTQMRGVALARAERQQARGEAAADPAAAAELKRLRQERAAAEQSSRALRAALAELSAQAPDAEALRARIDTARAQAAALRERAAALAQQLDQTKDAGARATLRREVQAAQQQQAALGVQTQGDAEALHAAQARREQAAALEAKSAAAEKAMRALDARIEALARPGGDWRAAAAAEENRRAADEQRQTLGARDAGLRAAVADLFKERGPQGEPQPQKLIAVWDDTLPILLLPVRVETRWRTEGRPELLVRVYPDDVAVMTHEPALTAAEVTHGLAYWTAWRTAAHDGDGSARADAQAAAWRGLAERCGANRAAWVATATTPANLEASLADAALPLAFPALETKPDQWSVAPHTRVLPDCWVVQAWRGDQRVVEQVGALIDDVVVLGPTPVDDPGNAAVLQRAADGTLEMGSDFAWVRDFEHAVAVGMGLRVPVSAADLRDGFDRLLVLGVKLSADANDGRQLVEVLIDNHRYARGGFALLPQGTPTNNTEGNDSGYARGARADGAPPVPGAAPPRFVAAADRSTASDGQRWADLLGIDYAPLQYAAGADLADHAEAVAMNRALYAGTLGYYLDHMLNDVVDEGVLGAVRRHFTDYVTGRGPLAAFRVGNQPYGLLVASALRRWTPTGGRGDDDVRPAERKADPFETGLLRLLHALDDAWMSFTGELPQVSAATGASDLLKILALHPTSAEFHQRIGYSYDYLRNVDTFAFGGANFDAVLRMMIESMGARAVLRALGYAPQRADGTPRPHPLLLQLVWRRHQTRIDASQLIDGLPLSERDGIKPYDAAGTRNYLDWLLEHAADADALEAQDFGGAARPGALLYLMAHFALVMEAGRAVHGWLAARGILGQELVRTRKFLNVAQPSPSVWEVFRAPADQVVRGESSSVPLLAQVHAPQAHVDAGVGLREQREALQRLRALPTARLERALVEHIDTLTYRLDAWQTSLPARRLHRQRNLDAPPAQRRTGLYIGAYGYLEHLQPTTRARVDDDPTLYESAAAGGYVHAPSLNHATAAALLRSGYLTHATPADPTTLAVDLSSARVRRARALVEGVRNGQSLEVLLGVQFERALHEWTTRRPNPVFLDQYKPLFRAQFPLQRTKVPAQTQAAGGAGLIDEDHTVTNGLALARTTAAFPYDIGALAALAAEPRNAIIAEVAALRDTLDALRDVLTAEAAYQLALGNFDRAAAIVQSAGNGSVPPDIEVLATPRGTGITFTQRLVVQLSAAALPSPWAAAPATPRALLEPALNAWLGDVLGAPERIVCRATALAADGTPLADGAGGVVEDLISAADLALQPIDFVYIVRGQVEASGAAELEERVRYRFGRGRALADDMLVRITFADAGADPGARSFAEVLPLAERLRRVLGTAKPLDARHFQSASRDDPPPAGNPGRVDVAELRGRVGAQVAAVRALFAALAAALTAARGSGAATDIDALRAALIDIANAGLPYALPRSAVGASAAQLQALGAQADELIARGAALGTTTDAQFVQCDAATTPSERKLALLAQIARAWMGQDLLLLPRFAFHDAAALAQAADARDELLKYARESLAMALPLHEWLFGAACVRPRVHDLELARAMADAQRPAPLAFAPLQLPYRSGDRWLGVQYPPDTEVVHDTVSIVQHLPQGFAAPGPQCGLLIDEWTEAVPSRAEVTGIAFNYDAPNSAPPQALLLAVAPRQTGRWSWDDLTATVLETFGRAQLRAVEPEQIDRLNGIGTLLPAVLAEFSTSRAGVSLDFATVHESIRAVVQQQLLAAPPQE